MSPVNEASATAIPKDPEVESIGRIEAVRTVLKVLLEATGLRLAVVARVTPESWTCCAVLDQMSFGLNPGDRLQIETTFCNTVQRTDAPLFLPDLGRDPTFADHPARRLYKVESYVAVPLRRRDGSSFGVLCALDSVPVPVRPETLEVFRHLADLVGYQLEYRDELESRDAQLLTAREEAELREQLIGIVSHDLRNPINAISISATDLLRRGELGETLQRGVDRILSASRRATRLIRDLLDYTQARTGKSLPVQRLEMDLHPWAEEAVEQLRPTAPDQPVQLLRSGNGRGEWDADRLSQVMSNLVGNAIQYGSPGSPIRVEVRDGSHETVELSVVSEGPPIPQALLSTLFQPMTRGALESNAERSVGLGLYIVERIAEAHGGSVGVSSSGEAGTRFTVRLPRAARG